MKKFSTLVLLLAILALTSANTEPVTAGPVGEDVAPVLCAEDAGGNCVYYPRVVCVHDDVFIPSFCDPDASKDDDCVMPPRPQPQGPGDMKRTD